MRLPPSKLAWLLSFLVGLFWAMALIGFLKGVFFNWSIGVFYALMSAFFWAMPGIIGVIIIEFIINSFEQTELLKEQNTLLRKLLERE